MSSIAQRPGGATKHGCRLCALAEFALKNRLFFERLHIVVVLHNDHVDELCQVVRARLLDWLCTWRTEFASRALDVVVSAVQRSNLIVNCCIPARFCRHQQLCIAYCRFAAAYNAVYTRLRDCHACTRARS